MDQPSSLLIVYSAQLLIVIGIAALAACLCRLSDPAWQLRYWRAVGVLCLALPVLAAETTRSAPAYVTLSSPGALALAPDWAPATFASSSTPVFAWVLLAGWLARSAWLLLGALRLRGLRQRSIPVPVDREIDELRSSLASSAEFRASADVSSPVSFGLARPVILLPRRFWSLDADGRRAVACHELLHVARRDWAHLLVEELARVLFWFHPGVWWLIERIQSSREALVDRLVVGRVGSRRAYMAALLAFADADVAAPSLAFLRSGHLRSRLRQLAQEDPMSRFRLVSTGFVLLAVMAGAGFGAARVLPLEIRLQAAQAGSRLEIRLAEVAPLAGLVEVAVPGGPSVYVHRDTVVTGEDVRTARVVERDRSQFDVAVTFYETAAARLAAATLAHVGRPMAILLDGRVISVPVLRAPVGEAGVINGLTADEARALAEILAPGSVQTTVAVAAGQVVSPRLLHAVKPQYSQAGMAGRIQGTVFLDAIVNVDGTVSDVIVIRSLAHEHGLDDEAVRAVKQWQFEPGSRNGTPVPVLVRLEVEFTLRSSSR